MRQITAPLQLLSKHSGCLGSGSAWATEDAGCPQASTAAASASRALRCSDQGRAHFRSLSRQFHPQPHRTLLDAARVWVLGSRNLQRQASLQVERRRLCRLPMWAAGTLKHIEKRVSKARALDVEALSAVGTDAKLPASWFGVNFVLFCSLGRKIHLKALRTAV